jgi:hypothetical protein
MRYNEWTATTDDSNEADLTVEIIPRSLGQREFWWTASAVVTGNAIYNVLVDLIDLARSELEGLIRSLS